MILFKKSVILVKPPNQSVWVLKQSSFPDISVPEVSVGTGAEPE